MSKQPLTKRAKTILVLLFIIPFAIFAAIIAPKVFTNGEPEIKQVREVDLSEKFLTPNNLYSIDSGNIVTVNMDDGTVSPYYEGEKMYEAAVTEKFVAFVDKDYKLKYGLTSEPYKSSEIETSINSDSLRALQADTIFYLTPEAEILEHDHKDDEKASEHVELIYFTGKTFDLEKGAGQTVDYDGEPIKITNFALSPDKKTALFYDIDNALYIHSFDTNKTVKEELSANRIGFINNDHYWVTETDGSTGSTNTTIYSLKQKKEIKKLTTNDIFNKLSILDIKQIGNYYVILGNDYSGGTPQQLIFVSGLDYKEVTPVVNLTEIGVNSNSNIYPTNDGHYFVDFRTVKDNKAAALRISLEDNSSILIDKLSTLFTGPF